MVTWSQIFLTTVLFLFLLALGVVLLFWPQILWDFYWRGKLAADKRLGHTISKLLFIWDRDKRTPPLSWMRLNGVIVLAGAVLVVVAFIVHVHDGGK